MRSWFSIFHVSFMPHGDSFVVQLLCPAAVVSLHDALTHAHARTRTHTHAHARTRTHAHTRRRVRKRRTRSQEKRRMRHVAC